MPPPTVNQLTDWLEAIHRSGVNLTAWEEQFVEDMQDKIDLWGERARFTPAQTEQIERIYAERVP